MGKGLSDERYVEGCRAKIWGAGDRGNLPCRGLEIGGGISTWLDSRALELPPDFPEFYPLKKSRDDRGGLGMGADPPRHAKGPPMATRGIGTFTPLPIAALYQYPSLPTTLRNGQKERAKYICALQRCDMPSPATNAITPPSIAAKKAVRCTQSRADPARGLGIRAAETLSKPSPSHTSMPGQI